MLIKFFCALFFIAVFGVCSAASLVKTHPVTDKTPQLIAAERQLAVEKVRNKLLAKKLQTISQNKEQLATVPVDANVLHRADLTIAIVQADLEGLTLNLNTSQQTAILTQNNIDALQDLLQNATTLSSASNQQQIQLQTQLKNQKMLLDLQQARIKALQQTQILGQQALTLAQDWKAQAQIKFQLQQQQSRQQALDELAIALQSAQQKWLVRLAELNQQLQMTSADNLIRGTTYPRLEMGIFDAEERTNLLQIQLDLARLHNRLEDLTVPQEQTLSLSVLTTTQKLIDTLHGQVQNISKMLCDKLSLLQKRIKIVTQSIQSSVISDEEAQANLNILNGLVASYRKQLSDATLLDNQIQSYQTSLSKQLNKQLAMRQGLPGFSQPEWFSLGGKLLQIPALAWQTLNGMAKPFITAIKMANPWEWILWGVVLICWGLIELKVRRTFATFIKHIEHQSEDFFATHVFLVFIKLLQKNLPALFLISGLIGLLLMMGLPLQLYSLIIELAFVVLVFAMLIYLARLTFLETTIDKKGSDVRLYHRLKWVLSAGGLLTFLTVLVHQLPVAYDIQDLFGRLFMLFLLVVVLVWIRSLEVVLALFEPYLIRKQPYIRQVVRLLNILIPLSILLNSLIGLIGYVELAWNIAVYQGWFLVVLTGYLLARGILAEVMKLFSEQVIRWSRNGWLWSEAFLKPLHQVLKIILLFEAFVTLFYLYGWGSHSWVVTKLSELLNYHLVTVANSIITPWNIIELFIIVAILVWAARWAREFSYRWLFAGTKDLGLRNSFAIFTQYAIVVIGGLFALRIAGINMTALTFIASAFAFGIGLGLRDLANNFVCGILLLIERPVQVGDYISVANFEGEVVHIGMRSITVTTDDHMELLVPNAEIFSKSFVNWTHRDGIVRTVITLRISREDDPYHVREIILDVLKKNSNIVSVPPPQVYFGKMSEMLLEFIVEYFIDYQKMPSRDTVRSQVLFALWERFQSENIHAPDYPHEMHIKGKLDFDPSDSHAIKS